MDLPPISQPDVSPDPNSVIEPASVVNIKRANMRIANVELANLKAVSMLNQTNLDSICPDENGERCKTVLTCGLSEGSDTILSQQVVSSPSTTLTKAPAGTAASLTLASPRQIPSISGNWQFFGASVNQDLQAENQADNVVEKIDSGQLWVVNSRRRNGLIVVREFHAEFAGPGAAVGGSLDEDVVKVIPIGNLSLLEPDSHEAHQNAIKIRLQWIRLTQNFTDQPEPNDRARMILEQFKTYFDQATVDLVPDEAFAMLVGVLPQTIRRVRSGFVW